MVGDPEIIWQSEADRALFARQGLAAFEDFMDFPGGIRICHKRGRSVVRMEFDDRAFYLKRNRLHPVEAWKALGRLRWPQLGARREWDNILAVRAAGIPTVPPVAVGERRRICVETASFTISEELYGAEPLDVVWRRDFAAPRKGQRVREKIALLRKMAVLARDFHGHGMNHQDLYLNHFFLGADATLYLLDLQRVQRRERTPRYCIIKDLAQLNYSMRVYGGFSNSDRLRLFLDYTGKARLDRDAKRFIHKIHGKLERIARHDVKLMERRRRRGELP